MAMERKYVSVLDKNFKEKYYFSPYDEKHQNLLTEFVLLEIQNAPEPNVKHVLDGVEERFYGEHILIGQAARVTIFDTVYDYLRENDLWGSLFVIPDVPEPVVSQPAAEDVALVVDNDSGEPPELVNA